MKIELINDLEEPCVVIHTSSITPEIQKIVSTLEMSENIIIVNDNDKLIVLKPEEIYMVRIENGETIIYCKDKQYYSKKRLYEFINLLNNNFMQISKSTIINLNQLDYVEPSFNSSMKLKLKNNCCEYISRMYLPNLKKYLGI